MFLAWFSMSDKRILHGSQYSVCCVVNDIGSRFLHGSLLLSFKVIVWNLIVLCMAGTYLHGFQHQ